MRTSPDPRSSDIPALRDAVRVLIYLGVFLGRKGDGEPGTQALQRLDDSIILYRARTRAAPG